MERRALKLLGTSLWKYAAESRVSPNWSRTTTIASSSYDSIASTGGERPSQLFNSQPASPVPTDRGHAHPTNRPLSITKPGLPPQRRAYTTSSLNDQDVWIRRVNKLRDERENGSTASPSRADVLANGTSNGRAKQKAIRQITQKTLTEVRDQYLEKQQDRSIQASAGLGANGAAAGVDGFGTNGLLGGGNGLASGQPLAASSSNGSSSASRQPKVVGLATTSIASKSLDSDGEDFDASVSQEVINQVYQNVPPPDVHVVNTVEAALKAAAKLMPLTDRVFGCDTEVMDIDVTKQSPNCHGKVICFSIYGGPDIDFGSESNTDSSHEQQKASMLWVDTYLDGDESRQDEARQIMEIFKPFWESDAHHKIWHNYSFDRHVMQRAGLRCGGFYGDTMHMARLWDSSRTIKGGYSLEALSSDPDLMGFTEEENVRGKISMKKLFAEPNLKKDGTEGKLLVLPAMEELQTREDTKWKWINYSAYDAKSTWDLYQALQAKLVHMQAGPDAKIQADYEKHGIQLATLWDVYCQFWRPFGALLTDMESAGMAVDREHLRNAQEIATAEEEDAKTRFRSWATSKVPDAAYMNVGSGSQVSQLLFAGVPNKNANSKPGIPLSRVFKVPNQLPPEEGKKAKKNMDITLHSVWGPDVKSKLVPDIYTPAGIPGCSTQVLKSLAGKAGKARKALAAMEIQPTVAEGLEAIREDEDEDTDAWSIDDAEITRRQQEKQEVTKPLSQAELEAIALNEGYGKLFPHFGTKKDGLIACAAVDSLIDASAIETLLTGFIVPLQSDDISKPDANGVYRVHCSLNINTETGRLSARRPNLQNQPALEKDRYKVRKAFTADRAAGKTLIVADYGQLELRILAHMAECKSMIAAFELGGDFHSRTALGMYDHIQRSIEKGDCLLEWDAADGSKPPVPLLKDLFAAERRKAKVLNFSIAYGKTAHGLSKDWGVTVDEANETVNRWYSDRPEVRQWQEEQHNKATYAGYVETILGRRRMLPEARSKNKAARAHAMRAAINTPIQGSAADVATAAMLKINANEQLRELGWRLLLQVHDEVILEGPKETAEIAQQIVIECMQSPFNGGECPLLVELAVDSKYAENWYEAK